LFARPIASFAADEFAAFVGTTPLDCCLNAATAYSGKTVEKQRDGRANLRPFVPGDPRINRRGRPKSFDEFRRLAQAIAHEKITDKDGGLMTRVEAILRGWATSKQPVLQLAFIAYCYGKPPEKLETTGLENKTTLILHYAHERPDLLGERSSPGLS
jgi:hypothetical protein